MIPYTIERRPDTGVTNGTMGVWLFVASETMLFGALFSAYALLRTAAATWPTAALPAAGAGINLGILAAVPLLLRRVGPGGASSVRFLLAAGSALAAVAVLLQVREYAKLIDAGVRPATHTFFATYFAITGLHALHVIFGVVANVWAFAGAGRVPPAQTDGRVRSLSVYWAFVAVVWLVTFSLFYL